MYRLLVGALALIQIVVATILLSPTLFQSVSADIKFDTQSGKTWDKDNPNAYVTTVPGTPTPAPTVNTNVTFITRSSH